MASNPITKVTAEEYLALDRAAEFRSEFLDGEIVAMSGGSPRHSKLQINLALEIETALRGTSCELSAPISVFGCPLACTPTQTSQSCAET